MKKLILTLTIMFLLVTSSAFALDFFTIRDNMNAMTDLQWDDYVNSLEGKTLTGRGTVFGADAKIFGGYELLVDMDDPDTLSVQDIYLNVSRSTAYAYNRGDDISFIGTIKSIHNILGSCVIILDVD